MKNTKKLVLASVLIAIAVFGSTFSFPVFASKCSPVQHLVNVLAAVTLGPYYSLFTAFIAALLRNIFGLGTLLAFPGSMCGAFLAGLLYKKFKNIFSALFGEIFGTGIIGGILAYPIALFIMGNKSAALFGYVIPFLISTIGGCVIASILLIALKNTKVLDKFN